jgi:hypothetical protein
LLRFAHRACRGVSLRTCSSADARRSARAWRDAR